MTRWLRHGVSLLIALALTPSLEGANLKSGTRVTAASTEEARIWGARIDQMVAAGSLTVARVQSDGDFPGRAHLRYDQRYAGLRVFGYQLVRQLDESRRTLTVFGRLLEGIGVDPNPTLSGDQAARIAQADMGRGAQAVGPVERVILALEDTTVLAYTLTVALPPRRDRYFIDAHAGAVVLRSSELRTISRVGLGRGVWEDRKKVSADSADGTFKAEDRLRPALIKTYDLRYDFGALLDFFNFGAVNESLLAADSDNDWTDGGVVDAHAYAGYVYDYYFRRHQRRGLDDNNFPMISVTHGLFGADPLASNAFWNGVGLFFGDGDGGLFNNFAGGLDVVGHEFTHGVTEFTWNAAFGDEPGALAESFSDIMGASVEFFFQPVGRGRLLADYFIGEDIFFFFDPESLAIRSMENPALFRDPDHYSRRFIGPEDDGGVHINAGISNQAFYLLVEGGTNRTSRIAVRGLGAANREKAERIFYRGFTLHLFPSARFSDARVATIQAAVELFGASSDETAQTVAAWDAVGVQ